jgi:hypothetical protein
MGIESRTVSVAREETHTGLDPSKNAAIQRHKPLTVSPSEEKQKRPAGRFLKFASTNTALDKESSSVTVSNGDIYAFCETDRDDQANVPAPRQGGEAGTVSCKPSHSFRV